jgi:hypothetical protein
LGAVTAWPLFSYAVAATSDVAITVSDKTMTAMKSPWADYFGTHYASTPDEAGKTWNTVRSYGGTRRRCGFINLFCNLARDERIVRLQLVPQRII